MICNYSMYSVIGCDTSVYGVINIPSYMYNYS